MTVTAVESAGSAGLVGLVELVKLAGLAGSTAKPVEAELESERITARDEAYDRTKWTDASRLSGSR